MYVFDVTLTTMRSAFPFIYTRRHHQLNVAAMALILCLWLVSFAAHSHAQDEASPTDSASSACTFCLSFPTGAAAPALQPLSSPLFVAVGVAVPVVDDLIDTHGVPSSYSSRAPPLR